MRCVSRHFIQLHAMDASASPCASTIIYIDVETDNIGYPVSSHTKLMTMRRRVLAMVWELHKMLIINYNDTTCRRCFCRCMHVSSMSSSWLLFVAIIIIRMACRDTKWSRYVAKTTGVSSPFMSSKRAAAAAATPAKTTAITESYINHIESRDSKGRGDKIAKDSVEYIYIYKTWWVAT